MLDLESIKLRSCSSRMAQEGQEDQQQPQEQEQQQSETPSLKIDRENDIYPFCIVWSTIPMISWIFPMFGHIGIGTSEGIIRDFTVSRHVCEDSFAFGSPVKYVQLKYQLACGWQNGWDNAIEEAARIFEEKKHGSIFNNCFTFVCTALNIMKYDGKTNWNQAKLLPYLWWNTRYVTYKKMFTSWLPNIIFYCFLGVTGFMIYDSIEHSHMTS